MLDIILDRGSTIGFGIAAGIAGALLVNAESMPAWLLAIVLVIVFAGAVIAEHVKRRRELNATQRERDRVAAEAAAAERQKTIEFWDVVARYIVLQMKRGGEVIVMTPTGPRAALQVGARIFSEHTDPPAPLVKRLDMIDKVHQLCKRGIITHETFDTYVFVLTATGHKLAGMWDNVGSENSVVEDFEMWMHDAA